MEVANVLAGDIGAPDDGTYRYRRRTIKDRLGNTWIQEVNRGGAGTSVSYGPWNTVISSPTGKDLPTVITSPISGTPSDQTFTD